MVINANAKMTAKVLMAAQSPARLRLNRSNIAAKSGSFISECSGGCSVCGTVGYVDTRNNWSEVINFNKALADEYHGRGRLMIRSRGPIRGTENHKAS